MDRYQEFYDGLSEDLKAKVTSCKTAEELIELAKTEGIELSDEQLDAASGGGNWDCGCVSDCSEDSIGV